MFRSRLLQHLLPALQHEASCSAGQTRSMGQLVLTNTGLQAGSGGRMSVSGITATVFGANGFLGRYVVSAIGQSGGRVVCPHRCDELDLQHLWPMGDLGNIVTLEDFSIRDDAFIRRAISKSNVVINLIGQQAETWNYGFEEVHTDFPRRLAAMCAETPRVERLIQVSELGAAPNSASRRLASKAAGDAAVLDAFPAATVLRVGPVVGVEDRFYTDLAIWRYSNSGVPLIDGGYNRVQPTYVVDVAEAIVKTLEVKEAAGAVYELGGPEVFAMKDVAKMICDEMREDVKTMMVPSVLAAPLASVRDWLAKRIPMHMLTRDVLFTSAAVAEGEIDKVVSPGAKGYADLHVMPRKVSTGIAIDHVRYWRKGGYMHGTNPPDTA